MAKSRYRQTQMLSSGHLDVSVGRAGRCRKPVLFNAVRPLSETYRSETGGGVYKKHTPCCCYGRQQGVRILCFLCKRLFSHKFFYAFLWNTEVKVVGSTQLGEVYGHQIAVFVNHGAAA